MRKEEGSRSSLGASVLCACVVEEGVMSEEARESGLG